MPFYKDHLNYDGFRKNCIGTELKFLLWPRQCYLTKKWLWFTYAYKQVAMWTGPGDPIFEYRWYNRDEFLIWNLKGIK